MQQYYLLKKEDSLAWALMPLAIERIKKFCLNVATDSHPGRLADLVQKHFVSDDPLMVVAVGVEKGAGVFAHCLACIDEITGNRFLTIMQFETDKAFEDREAVMEMLGRLKVWGMQHGAAEAQLLTSSDALVEVFEKRYGFKKHRILMRCHLMEK